MRRIRQLNIRQFRNLSDVSLSFEAPMQLIHGDNGAGKSSILEAIVTLATGRSWRNNHLSQLIQHQCDAFSLQATLQHDTHTNTIGMKRHRSGQCQIHLSENPCSLGELARHLPTQLISTHSYRFLTDGPKQRRSFFNWGLFHVEPSFNATWQRWQKILKQRNAALKNHNQADEVHVWDTPLAELANFIDDLRSSQLTDIQLFFQKHLDLLKHPNPLELVYERGWAMDVELLAALKANYRRDSQLGYTQLGPQKADFQVLFEGAPAAHTLSQGQQKLAMVALHLAQVDYLKQKTDTTAIVLLDDLTAELDCKAQKSLLNTLRSLDSQTFITSIDTSFLNKLGDLFDGQVHHVINGETTEKSAFFDHTELLST